MRIAMMVGGPLQSLGAAARMIEAHGYDSIWTAETGSSAYISAAIVAGETSRARVGTAIATAFTRSPGVTAMNAVDIDEMSGGRFVLGLGSQVKRVNELRFSTPFDHPAPRMREYVQAVRAFIGGYFGEEPSFEGKFYTIRMAPWPRVPPPVRREVPVFLAAVNKHMLRVSGEVADGIVGHPMTSLDYIEKVVKPNIAKGAAKSGRDPRDVELAQQVIFSIAEDREIAKSEVKQQIGFYATTRTYIPVLALHGFDDIVPMLREAYQQKDMKKLSSLVSDEMAETFGLFGTADEVKEKAAKFDGAVDELVIAGPWYRVDPLRLMENYRSLLSTFAR